MNFSNTVKNTSDMIAALSLRSAASLAMLCLTIAITRALGAKESGIFIFCYSLAFVVSTIARFGYDNAIVKGVAESVESNMHDEADIVSIAQWRILKAACIITVTCELLVIPTMSINGILSDYITCLAIMTLAIIPQALTILYGCAFQGAGKINEAIIYINCSIPVATFLSIVLLNPNNSTDLAWIYLAVCILSFLLSMFRWRTLTGRRGHHSDAVSIKYALDYNKLKDFLAIQILSLFPQWSGQIALGAYGLTEQIAFFSAAQRLSMIASSILMAINTVIAPRFARLFSANKLIELQTTIINLSRLLWTVGLTFTTCTLFFGGRLLELFGNGFEDAIGILNILLIGQFINCITGAVAILLQMTGHASDVRKVTVSTTMVMIVLIPLFVPLYGALGAAMVTSFAIGTVNLSLVMVVKKRLGINSLAISNSKHGHEH